MKKTILSILILTLSIGNTSASFMFQEIDPICSISGKTHTSFPGEISDTSSWSIPKAYDGECEKTIELSQEKKEIIYKVMLEFFQKKNYTGPIYGEQGGYSGEKSLNPEGQKFVNKKLFPTIIKFIEKERAQPNTNTRKIAIVNSMVQTIGYDYFIREIQ